MPVSLQEELLHYAEYLQEKYNQNYIISISLFLYRSQPNKDDKPNV